EVGGGVRVLGINEDKQAPRMVYDPAHPDANQEGYVAYPNVDIVREMVDMITASRAYEANATAINTTKQMITRALQLGKS
ncbi:MAG: flagellar basal body rod protein FlgC, partial [Candidatus Wallbacteria bacterium]|nr:flagellar basal body rod protein FlgC [Candidatus Wallbacteria bacterium]